MSVASIILASMPLSLPKRQVLSRLGHDARTKLAPKQERFLQEQMHRAFALVKAQGVYRCLSITSNDGEKVMLADRSCIYSRDLAKMLSEAQQVWLAAVSIGAALEERCAQLFEDGQAAAAAVYDAVGSESADAAMDFLQEYVGTQLIRSARNLSKFRFSPGYGDWSLEAQKDFFFWLNPERIGLQLNEKLLLIPEKSVTALAGIKILKDE